MNPNRLTEVMSAVCLALMFGLLLEAGASDAAFALLGFGAALMVAACVFAEF